MGLRTPEQLLRNKNTPAAPRAKFSSGQGFQIRTDFLDTASKALADKEKQQLNLARVRFKNDQDTLRTKAEGELADLNGVEAISGAKDIREDYMASVTERLNNVPERFRNSPEFQADVIQGSGKFNRHTISYVNAEARKLEDDSYKARVANDMNNMVEQSGDVAYITGPGADVVEQSIRDNAARQFGDDNSVVLESGATVGEVVDAQVYAGVSDSFTKAIKQQLTSNRPDLAKATLAANIDRIAPADRIKISKMIEANQKDNEDLTSLSLATEALRVSGGDRVAASQYIIARSGGDIKVANKAISFAETQLNIRKKQKDDNNEKTYNNLFDTAINGGGMDMAAYRSLPPEGENSRESLSKALNETSSRGYVITNQKAKADINIELSRMTDEDIAKINPVERYGSKLSAKDLDLINTRVEYSRKRVEKGQQEMQKWTPRVYRSAGFDMANTLGFTKEDPEFQGIMDMSEEIYSRIITENPRIKESELRKALIRELNDRTSFTSESRSFLNRISFGNLGDVETVSERRLPTEDDPGLPSRIGAERIRKMNEELIRSGRPVLTEKEKQDLSEILRNR